MLTVMPSPFSPEMHVCFGKTSIWISWYSDSLHSRQEQEVARTNGWAYSQRLIKMDFEKNSST